MVTLCKAENWVKRRDFDVSQHWKIKQSETIPFRLMFDFYGPSTNWSSNTSQGGAWHCVLAGAMFDDSSRLSPGTEKLVNLPVFRDSYLCFRSWPGMDFRKVGTGETPITMDHFFYPLTREIADMADKNGRFFTVLSRYREGQALYDQNFTWDLADFRQFKESHPHFLGFFVSEWCNDFINSLTRRLNRALEKKEISQAEYEAGIKRYTFSPDAPEITKYFTWIFKNHAAFLFNDPGNILILHAFWNLAHLSACNGAAHLMLETTNTTGPSFAAYRWQGSMFYTRGAARQFQIPWSWFIASYYSGFDTKGEYFGGTHFNWGEGKNPWGGMSRSLVNRAYYLSWLSGALTAQRESAGDTLCRHDETGEYKLTPYGEDIVEFYDLTQKYDRGVSYTPIALLTPYEQAQVTAGGTAYSRAEEYTKGLYMTDAVFSTILPGYDRPKAIRKGFEGCLFNSKYGDGFDVLNPDAPSTNPLKILPGYKVAILLGEYSTTPAMAKTLMDYVDGGGTLVINVTQLDSNYPENFTGIHCSGEIIDFDSYRIEQVSLLTAKVIRKDSAGNTIFTCNEFGRGHVIVTTPQYMTPSPDEAHSRDHALSGFVKYEHIQALLDKLTEETYPVRVTGNIQYGINRTPKGYLVYLFNNQGVTKFVDTKETIDPEAAATITLELKDGELVGATELTTGKQQPISGKTLNYTVTPGEVALLMLENNENP